ncbi:sulfatase [Saccharicrinis fermentans]|uniref:Arylsulfatase n=2 Tax=Saccharicrinis fermentans TaxID=982 RepID=W7YH17_9BACT|nr:sulfatase [Saccharicrinis fermentans]GAF03696.1 arylsulfatase [Saccharicrinis fermentans DSM 9555 = JCM 21142]
MIRGLVIFIALGFLLTACMYRSDSTSLPKDLPNVVLIVVDDMGWTDCGFMGSEYYETPNIDQLAKESMVFTNAYAGAANCAPSRAALMSGMNSPRTGIYTVSPSDRGNVKSRKLIPIKNTEFLADSVYTMAEMFKDAGYVTGHFGKWHLGENPCTQGFDVNVGGGPSGHPKSYFAPYIYPDLPAPKGEYLTDRLTNEAITFLENNKKNPFFLYMPFYTVHTPIQGKEAIVQKYKSKASTEAHHRADYAAMVESMDYSVGRILNKIDNLKLDNTLIVFTSDNGGIFAISKQWPLRAGKGAYYEGGIRVPLTIKWKGYIEPGKTNVPVLNMDFYPTFRDIIQAKIPANKIFDGVSLKGLLLENKELEERSLFFHFPVYLQAYSKKSGVNRDPLFRTRPGTAMIRGDWKMIYYYEDEQVELFNLREDISESNNLAQQLPEIVREMKKSMDDWIVDTKAPVPSQLNSDYDEAWNRKQINKYRP